LIMKAEIQVPWAQNWSCHEEVHQEVQLDHEAQVQVPVAQLWSCQQEVHHEVQLEHGVEVHVALTQLWSCHHEVQLDHEAEVQVALTQLLELSPVQFWIMQQKCKGYRHKCGINTYLASRRAGERAGDHLHTHHGQRANDGTDSYVDKNVVDAMHGRHIHHQEHGAHQRTENIAQKSCNPANKQSEAHGDRSGSQCNRL
jgi:hypothetical protein